ncbi:MAG: 3-oxo-5-alpha-steroid 4-dehydrogenase [Saprospiraceae bacterium]|nr:3-oxo-5-alpha-steroid 4-dehydrogenase [Saprospiraceae bacterium]
MSLDTLNTITWVWIGIAAVVHITMFYITAPFGRHTTEKWGKTIDNKLGWFIMEAPSLLIMAYFLFFGSNSFTSEVWVLFACWILHYFNRTIVYPLRIKPTPKRMPVAIVASAVFFNLINAGLNGYYLAELAPNEKYGNNWLSSPSFYFGSLLFFGGMYINWKSDAMLIALRKPGETGYKIPQGFLFKYVASPNLFGEIIEWSGFALMAWNLPALSFMIWTLANLVPRAKNHYDWYLRTFADFPKERKVVFPFLY